VQPAEVARRSSGTPVNGRTAGVASTRRLTIGEVRVADRDTTVLMAVRVLHPEVGKWC